MTTTLISLNASEDYTIWYMRLCGYLLLKGLWGLVDLEATTQSTLTLVEVKDEKEKAKETEIDLVLATKMKSDKALGIIIMLLGKSVI